MALSSKAIVNLDKLITRQNQMNPNSMRLIDRVIGVPACFIASALDKIIPLRKPKAYEKKILIVLLSEMGSLVLAYPMIQELKSRHPDAQLHALLFHKNKEALMLLNVIDEDNILTISDKSITAFLADAVSALFSFWRIKFDVIIDCELFARISSLFSWLSFAPIKIGFHRHKQEGLYRGSFLSHPIIYNPYLHISTQFMHLAQAIEESSYPLGKVVIAEPTNFYQYPLDNKLYEPFIERLKSQFTDLDLDKLVLIYPSGGILPIRAWPEQNYVELANKLIALGYVVAIIGLPSDQQQAEDITQKVQSPNIISLTGYTKSIKELLMLLQTARLLITNDGGPAHFASLMNTPCMTFFGPETPHLYGPKTPKAHNLYVQTACSPCLTAYNHRNSPCNGDNQCLKQISVEQVVSQAQDILATVS